MGCGELGEAGRKEIDDAEFGFVADVLEGEG